MKHSFSFEVIGTLEKPIDIRQTERSAVANLFIKSKEQLKADGSVLQRSQSAPITIWSDFLHRNTLPTLKVGDLLLIEGHMERKKYDKNGVTVWTMELVGDSILVLGGAIADTSVAASDEDQSAYAPVDNDDPFNRPLSEGALDDESVPF